MFDCGYKRRSAKTESKQKRWKQVYQFASIFCGKKVGDLSSFRRFWMDLGSKYQHRTNLKARKFNRFDLLDRGTHQWKTTNFQPILKILKLKDWIQVESGFIQKTKTAEIQP